jgi:hypothetical protein
VEPAIKAAIRKAEPPTAAWLEQVAMAEPLVRAMAQSVLPRRP